LVRGARDARSGRRAALAIERLLPSVDMEKRRWIEFVLRTSG